MNTNMYGFTTFARLKVTEIQAKTYLEDGRHIPSKENIANILGKGAKPSLLLPGSIWQHDPPWMVHKNTDWLLIAVNRQKMDPAVTQDFNTS